MPRQLSRFMNFSPRARRSRLARQELAGWRLTKYSERTEAVVVEPIDGSLEFVMTDGSCRYRGYDIVPRREWSKWCVSVYPTRPDLPILSRSTLRTLTSQIEEALAEAKQSIDRILS